VGAFGKGFLGCLGVGAALIVVIVVIAAIGNAGKSSPTSSPAAGSSPAGGTSVTKSGAPKAAGTAAKLLDQAGAGTKTTAKFAARGDWDLKWSYDCAGFAGGQGNFQVMVYNGDASMNFSNAPVNQLGTKGQDIEHYHSGGTFYLVVNSECSWHVTATG
jgi:hypothetical protein